MLDSVSCVPHAVTVLAPRSEGILTSLPILAMIAGRLGGGFLGQSSPFGLTNLVDGGIEAVIR